MILIHAVLACTALHTGHIARGAAPRAVVSLGIRVLTPTAPAARSLSLPSISGLGAVGSGVGAGLGAVAVTAVESLKWAGARLNRFAMYALNDANRPTTLLWVAALFVARLLIAWLDLGRVEVEERAKEIKPSASALGNSVLDFGTALFAAVTDVVLDIEPSTPTAAAPRKSKADERARKKADAAARKPKAAAAAARLEPFLGAEMSSSSKWSQKLSNSEEMLQALEAEVSALEQEAKGNSKSKSKAAARPLEVKVPRGVGPGDTFTIKVGGDEVEIEVPKGCSTGTVLQIEL